MKVIFSSLICEEGIFKICATLKEGNRIIHKKRIISDILALKWLKSVKYSEVLALRDHLRIGIKEKINWKH